MATPDRTLLTEANVNDLSPLGRKLNETSGRLNVVEVATGTQYGNVPTLTNVTEIPSDVSGRVDLVYTEPTTVHFANPGLTDIVLSIEGYEHVTWEGVAVHGTPDITGVVWASAMWRDVDSTWHLLCEQDASSGGSGGALVSTVAGPLKEVTYIKTSTGFPERDSSGLSKPYEATIPQVSWSDVLVKWIEPIPGGGLERHTQPVKTGHSHTFSIRYWKHDYMNPAEPLNMTTGFAAELDISIQGPDVYATGVVIVGAPPSVSSNGLKMSQVIATSAALCGFGDGIDWSLLSNANVEDLGSGKTWNLEVQGGGTAGLRLKSSTYTGGVLDPPAPYFVLPANPNRPDGLWVIPLDLSGRRAGTPVQEGV